MNVFLARMGKAFIDVLPENVVRLLFVLVLAGALFLHITAIHRIEKVEQNQIEMKASRELLLERLNELTLEVRGYRADIIEQNKELRRGRGQTAKP